MDLYCLNGSMYIMYIVFFKCNSGVISFVTHFMCHLSYFIAFVFPVVVLSRISKDLKKNSLCLWMKLFVICNAGLDY